MVFSGSLGGSNTASTDSLTTTGLVTTPALRIGPVTTVNEEFNFVRYGFVGSIANVTDTAQTLVTVTQSGIAASTLIFVTPWYGGGGVLPSLYVKVYDQTSGSFRVSLRFDNETPTTHTCGFYWVAMN